MIENSISVNGLVVWSRSRRGGDRMVTGLGHGNDFHDHVAARFAEIAFAQNVISIENAARLVARNLFLRSGRRRTGRVNLLRRHDPFFFEHGVKLVGRDVFDEVGRSGRPANLHRVDRRS